MRTRLLSAAAIIAAVTLVSLSGCSTINDSSTSTAAQSGKPKQVKTILFDYPFTSLPVYSAIVKYAKKEAKAKGVNLELTNDNMQLSAQVSNLTADLNKNVDAVVSFPADAASIDAISKQYLSSGKYFVAYANKLDDQSAFLGLNAYDSGVALGKNAGDWITQNLGGKGSVEILSDHSMWFSVQRTQGIEDGLKKAAPNATIVAEQDGITPDQGLSITTSVLAKNPNLNVVLSTAGDAAQGAYQALTTAGRNPKDAKTYVGGDDPNVYGMQQMKAGNFFRCQIATGTAEEIGKEIVDIPLALAAGKSTDEANWEPKLTLITPSSPDLDELIKAYS